MTDNADNTPEDEAEVTETVEETTAESITPEDDDPMLVEMREAEAEIAASDAEKGEGEPDPAKADEDKPDPEEAEKPEDGAESKADTEDMPQVPLARLNQVLSENDRLKENLTYTQGIVNTQKEMLQTFSTGKGAPGQGDQADSTPTEPTDHEGIIAKAESDKLELAQKYEDGEISLVELETQRVELDRSIRNQNDLRTQELFENAKQVAAQTVSANNMQVNIETEAVKIQEEHPYVARIDALPPAISNGVWAEIEAEAIANLAANGVAVNNSVESRVALMKEKAALTNTYGPQYTGTISKEGQQTEPGTKAGLSDTAKEREAKLNLAESQPPQPTGTAADQRHDLTEQDIENMDQDQIADMLTTAPQIVTKAAGLTGKL